MLTTKNPLIFPSAAAAVALVGLAHAAVGQSVTDAMITNQVDTEYAVSDAVDGYRITVSTRDGKVTLAGTVRSLLEKRQAEQIALSTVGVRSVNNNIKVRPGDHSDGEMRRNAEQALRADPAADAYEVGVAVKRGKATLTGAVDSFAESRLAEAVVASAPGVREIDNELSIEYETNRPDSEIEADVTRRLGHRVDVDDRMIDVAVSDGDVTLSGTVSSAAERRRAQDLAWVAGVESVDIDELDVKWWARGDMRRTDLYPSMTDGVVRGAVEEALQYSPLVDPYGVTIAADDGIVTLSGTVDDLRAKNAAEELAEITLGVCDVRNHLRVAAPGDLTDESLEGSIRAALLRDVYVDRSDITVAVANRHAHLYGHVDTSFEKNRASDVVESIDGIVDVSNYLVIEDAWQGGEDWEIADDIRGQLFWSPFVDSDQVNVTVVDGVATLDGTVGTIGERAAAVRNAYEGGARLVDNNLRVDYGPDPLLP